MSFDDLPFASLLVPALSTVHQPLYDLGAAAADLLLKRLDRPETPPEQMWLPTHLIIRQSSGSPLLRPGADGLMAFLMDRAGTDVNTWSLRGARRRPRIRSRAA